MDTIDLLLQQNAKQFQEIRQLLELVIRQNQNNNPNPNLEASLLQNKSLSVKFTNFLQDSFSDIYDKLKDIENKSTKEEQISYKENFESLKNQADQILGVLNLINNKETEKLADNFKAIEEKLSKLIEVSDKEVYSDKKVIAEISLLCDEVEKVKDSIKPFDFEKLSAIQSDNFEKVLKHNFSVDLDKYQKPKNALAVKIYDKDGNVIERFGGGGGGYPDVSIKNIAGSKINPATNEKLDEVITALGAVSIDTTGLATSAKQLPDGHAVVIKNSAGVVQNWEKPQGQEDAATSISMVLCNEQGAILNDIKTNTASATGYEVVGLKNAEDDRINPGTEETLQTLATETTLTLVANELKTYAIQYAVNSGDSTITYVGKAVAGSTLASALWQIKKITDTSGDLSIQFADGDANFDNVWNDRESLSYS